MSMQRVGLLTAVLLLSACASTGEKPPEPTELVRIEAPVAKVDVVWRANAGDGFENEAGGFRIAVQGNKLFTADEDGRVRSFSLENGKRLWSQNLGQPVASGPGVVDDLVVVGTREGEVIALHTGDGSQRWKTRASGEVLAPAVGSDGVVVIRSFDGFVYGLGADGGQRLWAVDRTVPTLTLRGIGAPLIVDGTVLVGTDGGKLLAVGLHDGIPLWESTVSVPTGRSELERLVDVDAAPVTDGAWVYAVSYAGDLVAFDLVSGEVQWRQSVASVAGMALRDDQLFVTDPECRVFALDRRNGDILWTRDELRYRECSQPAMHRGLVAVGDLDGYIHWLSPEDGAVVARNKPVGDPIAPPIVVDGRLLVLSVSGRLAAVDLLSK